MIALANFANNQDRAWPSVQKLETITQLSGRAIRNILPKLEIEGIIMAEKVPGKATVYTLGMDPDPGTTYTPPRHLVHPNHY